MFKKVLSLLLILLTLTGNYCLATGLESSQRVVYRYTAGDAVVEEYTTGEIYAITTYENNSGMAVSPVLLVCTYNTDGKMTNVYYNHNGPVVPSGESQEIKVKFTPVSGETVKTTLIDSMKTSALKPESRTSKLGEVNTHIESIEINGKAIDGYSDSIDSYMVKVDANTIPQIKADPVDGSSTVSITMPESIPGDAKIKVTSAIGQERNVALSLYSDEQQLTALKGITYKNNGEDEFLEFAPGKTKYEVVLNDNTFYTNVYPETHLAATSAEVKVLDLDFTTKKFGENAVGYYNGAGTIGLTTAQKERPALYDNQVPIKNEETKAIVYASCEGKQQMYEITFKCKQPNLTELNFPSYVTLKPAFITGAAVNNDNATVLWGDRTWFPTSFSKTLIGCSAFIFDTGTKGESFWANSADKGDVFFSFKADTAGTIYFMDDGANYIATNYNTLGWEQVSTSAPIDARNLDGKHISWNEYGDDTYFFCIQGLADNKGYGLTRYDEPYYTVRIGASTSYIDPETKIEVGNRQGGSMAMMYKKDFEAGELVTVECWSDSVNKSQHLLNGVFIKWDLEADN